MGRVGISYEEVELAAEKILQDGETPTIERIRIAVGTGSNTTISKYLSEWKKQRMSAMPDILPSLKTPPDPVNLAVQRVWQQMAEENEVKIKAIQASADQKTQKAQEDKELAITERDRLLDDNQALRDLLKQERAQGAELEKSKLDLTQDLAVTHAQLELVNENYKKYQEHSENLLTELQTQQITLNENHNEANAELKSQHTKAIDTITKMSEDHRHKLIVDIDELKTQNGQLRKQLTQKDEDIANFGDIFKSMEAKIEQGSHKVSDLESLINKCDAATSQQYQNIANEVNQSIQSIWGQIENIFANQKGENQIQFNDIKTLVVELEKKVGKYTLKKNVQKV